LVAASACSTGGSGESPATRATSTSDSVITTDVATGLDLPWGLARLPDGSHLVSLRDEARVLRVSAQGERADVPATGDDGRVPDVEPGGEGGLLGLAVKQDEPGTVYAYLTAADDNRVVAMPYDGERLGEPKVLLTGIPKAGNHNGGRLAFGPDGMLYVTTGDAGEPGVSQSRESLGGKILRITTSGAPAPGNPFAGSPVWSYGHRNVQGIGWDPAGRMYASEFGQNTWDELNLVEPGGNYGWPDVEGAGGPDDVARGFTAPLQVWRTSDASPSGLAVSKDAIYLAALRGERLWKVPLDEAGATGTPTALLQGQFGRLRAVEVEPDGSLLVLTSNSSRGQQREGDDRLVRVQLRN
jgi:glucose/arabinose dehydrogenase